MAVTDYSRTPADNDSAPPNGWPEGMAPSAVNNCARQMMTDIVEEAAKNGAKVLATVAGTDTITATMTPDLDAYAAGMIVVLTPANTNTGATTLNIDSLGALDVQKFGGTALVAGDLVAGIPAFLILDSGADDWILLNPIASTAKYADTTANFTGTLQYGGIEVGYRGLVTQTQSGNYTILQSDNGQGVEYGGAGGHTYTCPEGTLTAGTLVTVFNGGSGNLTLAATTSTNMFWMNGSGTISTGNRTLVPGAVVSVYRRTQAAHIYTWGTGIS